MRIFLFRLFPRCINLRIQSLGLYNEFCSHLYLTYYLMFYFILVFIACLMSLRMFICAYALDTVFYACFSIHIYRYTCTYLISNLLPILLFLFMLLVITCTCMPEPHHLIMYTCDRLSTPTGFILRTRWVIFWQSWTLMSKSRSLNRGGLCATETWISGCL